MAWLSVANSHEDLLRQLVQNGVLHEGKLLDAFRVTDRRDFVEEEDRTQAYADRPFKKGSIHISAPHMYATVLEALDLSNGKSFLNIGSGSGYLSCLAAYLLGEEGVSHGVEISEVACNFSRDRAKRWHAKLLNTLQENSVSSGCSPSLIAEDGISFVNANCFDIDILNAASTMKYDRIYVGGGCPDSRKEFFLSMLADDGILVAPINEKNQMLSIKKFYGRVYSMKAISNVNFAPLIDTGERTDEEEIISILAARAVGSGLDLQGDIEVSVRKVQAAPASASYIIHPIHSRSNTGVVRHQSPHNQAAIGYTRVRLPSLVWMPTHRRHLQFPQEFRRSIKEILLANNRLQSSTVTSLSSAGFRCRRGILTCSGSPCCHAPVPSFLPHHIWLYIFSFASREWFQPVKSDLQSISLELSVERRLRSSAEDRLRRTEEELRQLQRENRTYQVILSRLHQHRRTVASNGMSSSALMDILVNEGMDMEEEEMDEGEWDDTEDEEDEEEDEEEDDENEWVEAQSVEDGEISPYALDIDVNAGDDEIVDDHHEGDGEGGNQVLAEQESSSQLMDISPAVSPLQYNFNHQHQHNNLPSSSPSTFGDGVWTEVASEHDANLLPNSAIVASHESSDPSAGSDTGVAASSAYNNYLQMMGPQEQTSTSAALTCVVSSYSSAMTGTTVESKGSSNAPTDASRVSSGERISDCTIDGAGYWNSSPHEEEEEEGDDEDSQMMEGRAVELYFDDSDL